MNTTTALFEGEAGWDKSSWGKTTSVYDMNTWLARQVGLLRWLAVCVGETDLIVSDLQADVGDAPWEEPSSPASDSNFHRGSALTSGRVSVVAS